MYFGGLGSMSGKYTHLRKWLYLYILQTQVMYFGILGFNFQKYIHPARLFTKYNHFAQMSVFSAARIPIPKIHSFTSFWADTSLGFTTICANDCTTGARCRISGIHSYSSS